MNQQLAVLVPVLNRPHRVAPLIENVAATTRCRLLFIVSESDAPEIAALEQAGADFIVVPDDRGTWACKVNDGVRATTEEWIFTGADDLRFHPQWFDRALAWADEDTRVIGTNDICNPRVMMGQHSTHTLFRRDYIESLGTIDEPGLVMHEGYGHDFTDDEAVGTAKARGVYVHAFDAIVEHLHPLSKKAPDDATYKLGRSQSLAGKKLYTRRRVMWANERKVRMAMVPVPERAVVVTASYGGYDPVLRVPVAQDIPVDYVCFSDREMDAPEPWKVIVAEPMFPENPRLSAKVPKMLPDVGCDDVVWVDASHEIVSSSFVREALACRHDGIAAFTHPRRDCVYAELAALLGSENQNGLYFSRPLLEQEQAYRQEGHPDHAGLFACGVMAWDLRHPKARELGKAWLDETEKWSHQDQVELPVVCRRLGVEPGTFPVPQIDAKLSRGRRFLANRWVRIHPHVVKPKVVNSDRTVSVLIPFTSDDPNRLANLELVKRAWEQRGCEVIEGTCEGEWSKGAALADSFSRASGDVLVIADADCLLDDTSFARAVQAVSDGAPWAVPHQHIWRMTAEMTRRVLAGHRPRAQGRRQLAIIGGGIVVVSRQAWVDSGGVDPRFVGWGGEDIAFGWALRTLTGPPHKGRGNLFHLWHQPHEPRRGSAASEELAGRYRRARGDAEAMRRLVAETVCV